MGLINKLNEIKELVSSIKEIKFAKGDSLREKVQWLKENVDLMGKFFVITPNDMIGSDDCSEENIPNYIINDELGEVAIDGYNRYTSGYMKFPNIVIDNEYATCDMTVLPSIRFRPYCEYCDLSNIEYKDGGKLLMQLSVMPDTLKLGESFCMPVIRPINTNYQQPQTFKRGLILGRKARYWSSTALLQMSMYVTGRLNVINQKDYEGNTYFTGQLFSNASVLKNFIINLKDLSGTGTKYTLTLGESIINEYLDEDDIKLIEQKGWDLI